MPPDGLSVTGETAPLRIALVCPYDWSVEGGVGVHVRELARQLHIMGHHVAAFAPASQDVPVGERVIAMGRPRPVHAMGTVARIRLGWEGRAARRALAGEAFDIVHVHEPLMPMLPYPFLRSPTGVKVGTFHAAREEGNRLYGLARPALRPLISRLDARIAVSPAARDLVSRYFPGDYRIIPNGIDFRRWSTPHDPLPEFNDGRFTILFVGRPEPRKGLRFLIEAFRLLRSRRDEVRLVVVGAGDFSNVEADCADVPGIVFRPNVPASELPRYHYSAHAFCAPNTGGESQGYVLMEAMAAGLPVVGSDIPGFAAVARAGKDALLVPPRSPDSIAAAIESLMDDRELAGRLGASARERAATYAWDGIAAQVMSCYRTLLAKANRGYAATP